LDPVGVAGVYGLALQGGQVVRAGRALDRDRLLDEPPGLPAAVETLDELVLALSDPSAVRLEPALGFHFYGADACLQARRRGLAAVAMDAPCSHNSRSVGRNRPPAGRNRPSWKELRPAGGWRRQPVARNGAQQHAVQPVRKG
jgi:hypothetical protein